MVMRGEKMDTIIEEYGISVVMFLISLAVLVGIVNIANYL